MKNFEILTSIAVGTYWKVIDLGTRAVGNLLLQCRTAADILLSSHPGIVDSYLILKSGTHLTFEPDGANVFISRGDELLTNGGFTGGYSGWTLADEDNWTPNANAMDKDADGTDALSQAFGSVAGDIYELTYTLSGGGFVAGVTPSIGGTSGTKQAAIGTYTECIEAADATGLVFTPDNASRFTLDTVSVKKLTQGRAKLFAKASTAVKLEVMIQN